MGCKINWQPTAYTTFYEEIDFINFSIKDWLNYAEIQVDMSNCMDKHFRKKNKSLVTIKTPY